MKYFCIVLISAMAFLATSQAASVETPEKLTPPAPLKDAASLPEATEIGGGATTLAPPPVASVSPPQNLLPKPRPAGPAGLSPLAAAAGRRPVRDAAEADLPSSSSTSTSTTTTEPTTPITTTSTETSVVTSESSSEPLPSPAVPSNATTPIGDGELVVPAPPAKLEAVKENRTSGGYGYSAMEHSKVVVEATTLLPEAELNSTSTSTESALPANATSGDERDARKFRKFFKVKFLG